MNANLKCDVYNACQDNLADKIMLLSNSLSELQKGVENDAKSSAGDKHETAMAMMQIEHAQLSKQLNEVMIQKQMLARINPAIYTSVGTSGSLIKTNNGIFFLALALGKIKVNDEIFFVLSPQSPLGNKLMRTIAGDSFTINNTTYVVENVI